MLLFGIIGLPAPFVGIINLNMAITSPYEFNLYVGILDIAVWILSFAIALKYYRKINKLKKEKLIRE